MVLDKLKIEGA